MNLAETKELLVAYNVPENLAQRVMVVLNREKIVSRIRDDAQHQRGCRFAVSCLQTVSNEDDIERALTAAYAEGVDAGNRSAGRGGRR